MAVLWLGNGVNRCFSGDSWKQIIEKILNDGHSNYTPDQIYQLPATMQIIAATQDHVDTQMKDLAKDLCAQGNDGILQSFLQDNVLNLPLKHIITPNYTYELEKAVQGNYSTSPANRSRKKTQDGSTKENQYMLYRYSQPENKESGKCIWHIHGEACTPSTMVMGQYYYGQLIAQMQKYLSDNMGYYKVCSKNGVLPKTKSWLDLFMTQDVYVIGFAMDLSEIDFWWLACYKKRHFDNTKIYVYEPNLFGDEKAAIRIMMEAYGIELLTKDAVVKGDEYVAFYEECFRDLKSRLEKGCFQ